MTAKNLADKSNNWRHSSLVENRSSPQPATHARSNAIAVSSLLVILLLSACSSVLPSAPKEVRIPVPVPCVDTIPARPKLLTDPELAKLDDFALVLQMRADGIRARDHIGVLEAVMGACIK